MKRRSFALSFVALAVLCSIAFGAETGPTHHSGEIDANEVWYPVGNPHILDGDVSTGDNVTLTIMPGCSVQVSEGAELYTGYANPGSIVAVGKADSMITFTSLSDTVPGFWNSISFYGNTISTARLSYVVVEYAGGGQLGAVVVSDNCAIEMDHCTVRNNAYCGVYCGAIGYFADFSNNTITRSGEYPVRIDAEYARTLGAGNTLTGNTTDGILVNGVTVKTSGTWLNHGVPYVIDGDVGIEDATNTPVLTIAAGTTIKLSPQTEFYVGYGAPGGLICDGTAGQITFTSSVVPPLAGDWDRLSFYFSSISSQCRLNKCKVEYAGFHDYGNIHISDCTPTVTGCDIGYSAAWGIYLAGSEYPNAAQLRADNNIHDYVDGDIRDPGAGVGEGPFGPSRSMESATVVRGVLLLDALGSRQNTGYRSELLDASGRKVLDLHPGANDVRALAPGVYFIREAQAQAQAQAVRKVILTR